jgi:hypothetical protein
VVSQYEKLCNRLYGSVAHRIPYFKYLLYLLPAVKTVLFYGEKVHESGYPTPCASIVVNNLKTYGGGSIFDENSSISDGKIEIAHFPTKLDYLKFIFNRTKLYRPAHVTRTVETPFVMEFGSDVPVQVDGEDYSGYFKGCRKFTVAFEGTITVCV